MTAMARIIGIMLGIGRANDAWCQSEKTQQGRDSAKFRHAGIHHTNIHRNPPVMPPLPCISGHSGRIGLVQGRIKE